MSKWRNLIEEVLAGTFFLTGCGLVVYGVVMRYVFHSPVFWVDEIFTYLLLWGIMIGWSLTEKEGRHIRVHLLYDFLPGKWQYRVSIFEKIVSLVFCGFFVYASTKLFLKYLESGQVSVNAHISLWIVAMIMPVAGILFALRFLEDLIFLLRKGKEDWKTLMEQKKAV